MQFTGKILEALEHDPTGTLVRIAKVTTSDGKECLAYVSALKAKDQDIATAIETEIKSAQQMSQADIITLMAEYRRGELVRIL